MTPREIEREAFRELSQADDAWSAELTRQFGKAAGDVRYTLAGHGAAGSRLRKLHDNREALRAAWEDARIAADNRAYIADA